MVYRSKAFLTFAVHFVSNISAFTFSNDTAVYKLYSEVSKMMVVGNVIPAVMETDFRFSILAAYFVLSLVASTAGTIDFTYTQAISRSGFTDKI